MTSTSFITGAGLKKCMPTTRPESVDRPADRGDRDRRRVRRQHRAGRDLLELAEQLLLELQALGRRLDDQLGLGEVLRATAAALTSPGSPLEAALGAPALEPVGDRVEPALDRDLVGVVQQRPCAGRRRELGDARAHRAGADDADDVRCAAHAAARYATGEAHRLRLHGDQRVDAGRRAADDQLLDLRRALVERRHARVAEEALDREVVGVARARRGPGSRGRPTSTPPRSRTASRSTSRSSTARPCPSARRRGRRAAAPRRCARPSRRSCPARAGRRRSAAGRPRAPWRTSPTPRPRPGRCPRSRRPRE